MSAATLAITTSQQAIEISPATHHALLRLLDYNRDKVQDVLQEACLNVIKSPSKFDGRSKYTTWFHRVAINTALIVKRRERVRQTVAEFVPVSDESGEFLSLCDSLPDSAPNPEERLLAQERNRHLREAILTLSPKRREVLLRYAIEDRRRGHPGESHRAFSNTEKARLFRAIRALRDELGVPE